ncbi:MAG: rod shape-determining protein RodA [Acidobacteriota bacterium]|nr:rod shape-determining protein RodA [Acidobacteriota bacterium]
MSGRRLLDSLDYSTLLAVLGLVGVGVLTIASATLDEAGRDGLWQRQLLWLAVGVVAAAVVFFIDYHVWAEFSLLLHGLVMVLLVAVLFVGTEIGGNRSWLVLGPFRLQPSELAKWTTCLVLATYLAKRLRGNIGLYEMIVMGVLVGAPLALIALQPDFGTALIFVPIYLAAILLGGLRWKVMVGLLIAGLLFTPVLWFQLEDYQQERILSVLDTKRDPQGVGYQAEQSKIAIGSGGMVGKGVFEGTQSQLNFLPAQHTDFILAVLAEELGFFGALVVLGLFYYLIYRAILASRSSQDRLGTYICLLVAAWITGQMAINVGMVLGVLPTIGVPLPFISYGGSALVAVCCGVGLVLNVRGRRFVNI